MAAAGASTVVAAVVRVPVSACRAGRQGAVAAVAAVAVAEQGAWAARTHLPAHPGGHTMSNPYTWPASI
eukprot:1695480-Alexandrium_andersonii.AAC.1